jgi:hypothetical protein
MTTLEWIGTGVGGFILCIPMIYMFIVTMSDMFTGR